MPDSTFQLPSGREIVLDRLPQRQDAMIEQVYDLWAIGMRLGMYDAADWLKDRLLSNTVLSTDPEEWKINR